jgi:hypothetical protein
MRLTVITQSKALGEYVRMFSTNAPGWSAKVVSSDTLGGVTRATIAFAGMAPHGSHQVQYTQITSTCRFQREIKRIETRQSVAGMGILTSRHFNAVSIRFSHALQVL